MLGTISLVARSMPSSMPNATMAALVAMNRKCSAIASGPWAMASKYGLGSPNYAPVSLPYTYRMTHPPTTL